MQLDLIYMYINTYKEEISKLTSQDSFQIKEKKNKIKVFCCKYGVDFLLSAWMLKITEKLNWIADENIFQFDE